MILLITWTDKRGFPHSNRVEGTTLWQINRIIGQNDINFHRVFGVRKAVEADDVHSLLVDKHADTYAQPIKIETQKISP